MQQEAMTASWLYDSLKNLRLSAHQRLVFSYQLLSQFQLRHQLPQFLVLWANLCSSQLHLGYFIA